MATQLNDNVTLDCSNNANVGVAWRGGTLAVTLVLVFSACGLDERAPLPIGTEGSLSENSLSENSLSENSLSENSLSENSLSENSLSENSLSENGLVSPDSAQLIEYMVKCALVEGDTLTVEIADVVHVFDGLLGVAPSWKHGALTFAQRESMSACLMAHVNHFGVKVPFSIRGLDGLYATDEEIERFNRHEGALFGNLFSPTPVLYACSADHKPDFDVAYGEHDMTAGDRLLRRCTDVDGDSSTTMCGFTYVGRCSDVCDTNDSGDYQNCYSNAAHTGYRHTAVANTWTLDHRDLDSVLDLYYDDVYGLGRGDSAR